MSRRPKYYDDSWRAGKLASWSESYKDLGYEMGDIDTEFGIATIYRQGPERPLTLIDFVFNGRRHRRVYEDILTRLACVRRARKFAKEIAEK